MFVLKLKELVVVVDQMSRTLRSFTAPPFLGVVLGGGAYGVALPQVAPPSQRPSTQPHGDVLFLLVGYRCTLYHRQTFISNRPAPDMK